MKLALILLAILMGAAIVRWSVRPPYPLGLTEVRVRVIGTTEPRMPGDTGTVCALVVRSDSSLALAGTALRMRYTEGMTLERRVVPDAVEVCRYVLGTIGIGTDSLPLTGMAWDGRSVPALKPEYLPPRT